MQYTRLGNSGLYVSRLALGTITYGQGGGFEKIAGVDAPEARKQLDAAFDRGVNFIDTANIYSGGDAEKVVARALGGRRDDVILTSKARSPVGDGPNDSGASRYHLTRAVEDSLTRLGTDHLDLLYIHQWDGQTPVRETVETANELIASGKIRYWGVSNYTGWQLTKTVYEAKALGLTPPIEQQVYYTPEAREIEYEILPAARDLGVGTWAGRRWAKACSTGRFDAVKRPRPRRGRGRGGPSLT